MTDRELAELDALLHALCDGRLDDAGRSRLVEVVGASDFARQRYVEMMDFFVNLAYCATAGDVVAADALARFDAMGLVEEGAAGRVAKLKPVDESQRAPVWRRPATGLGFWAAAASVALLLGAAAWLARGPAGPVGVVEAPVAPANAGLTANEPFVARIVRATPDVVWGDGSAELEFLLRLRAGDRIHLTSGIVELEFAGGAQLLLRGPAAFVCETTSSGRLESGELTGNVSRGNFRLMTPWAEVIDLGTEFGVSVDAKTGADVVVFDGEVEVVARDASGAAGDVLRMSEGMAARVGVDGATDFRLGSSDERFARSFPLEPTSERSQLSIVDVLAGGDGYSGRLAGAIDPTSGEHDTGEWRWPMGAGRRNGDGLYHVVGWHPLVDGVFVPSRNGVGVQVDSAGARIDLPPCEGQTFGPIWARRWTNALCESNALHHGAVLAPEDHGNIDYWGTGTLGRTSARLASARIGMVGFHPNVGVTFDLRAIRLQQHREISAFSSLLANMDASAESTPDWAKNHRSTADFRVYVDGQLRYARLGFGLAEGEAEVNVPLRPEDRFLTFVSSDGNVIKFDHVVLIDPVLVLE